MAKKTDYALKYVEEIIAHEVYGRANDFKRNKKRFLKKKSWKRYAVIDRDWWNLCLDIDRLIAIRKELRGS